MLSKTMKKAVLLILVCFLVLGIMFNSINVLADSDDDSSDSDSSKSSDSDSSSSDDDKDKKQETKTKSIFIDEEGSRVEITTETKIKNGEEEIKIKKKIRSADGSRREIEIEIKIKEKDGVLIREIKFKDKFKGYFEVKTKLKIKEIISSNDSTESILRAILSNGSEQDIKFIPDKIAEIAIEKLKTTNYTIELKEKKHKNIPRVVYNIKTNKHGKFLGIFKMKVKIEADIDPETGEFLGISRPWWAFLVGGLDEPEEPPTEPPINDTNQTGNTTLGTPAPGNTTVDEMIVGNTSSNGTE